MLSPLSWWNDLLVNVPLAFGFAWLVALIAPKAFMTAAVIGYWLTNVAGFLLMHKGAVLVVSRDTPPPFSWRAVCVDVAISLGYTLLIVVLVQAKWVQAPQLMLR